MSKDSDVRTHVGSLLVSLGCPRVIPLIEVTKAKDIVRERQGRVFRNSALQNRSGLTHTACAYLRNSQKQIAFCCFGVSRVKSLQQYLCILRMILLEQGTAQRDRINHVSRF